MTLNIGDQQLTISVPFERQDFVRDVEQSIAAIYGKWRKAFPQKTDREILAMVTYQFAEHYREMRQSYELAQKKAEECLLHAENGSNPAVEDDFMFD